MWMVQARRALRTQLCSFQPRRSRIAHKRGIVGSTPPDPLLSLTVSFMRSPHCFGSRPQTRGNPVETILRSELSIAAIGVRSFCPVETVLKQGFDSLQRLRQVNAV